MAKIRPRHFLRKLGRQIRARRTHLGLSRKIVAEAAEISTQQLMNYEIGEGHAPVATLHRIALALGTTTSELIGETAVENASQVDEMLKVFTSPTVAAVVGNMRAMTREDRHTLKLISSTFAARQHKQAEATA